MKIWNVCVFYSQWECTDLGTFGTKLTALEAAKSNMAGTEGWKPCYESDEVVTFRNGNWELKVESIYVA